MDAFGARLKMKAMMQNVMYAMNRDDSHLCNNAVLTDRDSRTTNRSPVICRYHSTLLAPLSCMKSSYAASCDGCMNLCAIHKLPALPLADRINLQLL